jgi:serine/threonine protein phosphatase PrpC
MMRLRVMDAVTEPARTVNEDGWIGLAEQVWVLDGASGLSARPVTDGPTDAAWLVETARRVVEQRTDGGLLATLEAIVHEIEVALAGSSATHPHELPSASLVAVELDGDALEVLTLGDCRVLLRSPAGDTRVLDDASVLDGLDRAAVELLADEQRRTGATLDVAREAIGDLLRSNRDLLNGPDGYRALAPGLAVADVSRHRIPVAPGTRGLLVSDGFYRLVDTFHVLDPDGLLDETAGSGARSLVDRLRAIEAEDPEGIRHPRLKRSDDATAVLFDIVASA